MHLIVSRTATGSSCRFVAAFAVAFLKLTQSSIRHRAASGLLHDMDGSSMSSNWGSRGSFPTISLPSSPLGSPRRWGGLGPRRNVSSFGSLDSSVGQDDDNLSVERYCHFPKYQMKRYTPTHCSEDTDRYHSMPHPFASNMEAWFSPHAACERGHASLHSYDMLSCNGESEGVKG